MNIKSFENIINEVWNNKNQVNSKSSRKLLNAISKTIDLLDAGEIRVAEKKNNEWTVNQWIKKAILLSFRVNKMKTSRGPYATWYDKVEGKTQKWNEKKLTKAGFRFVPNGVVRKGAFIAKNVVASKIANKCLIQLAYAIGISKPLSIYVDLFDDDEKSKHVENLIKDNFDLSPRGIREMLSLNKPIYECTAAYGHFGREPRSDGSFSWEKTDKTAIFKK